MSDNGRSLTRRKGRAQRYITYGVWVCLGLVLLWGAAMLRLIVFPPAMTSTDSVGSVDAVYVLGVATEERLARGLELVEAGTSDQLVVTVTRSNPLDRFCSADHAFSVHCVSPDPVSTRGEAREWAQVADDQQWDSVAIVTMRSHATRTMLYFDRCFPGEVHIVDDEVLSLSTAQWMEQFVYETGAMLKFVASKGC